MLRSRAAGWLARLQSGREPNIEQKFRIWYDADAKNAAAFDRISRSYQQAGLLRNLPEWRGGLGAVRNQSAHNPPRFAIAAGILFSLLIPPGILLFREAIAPFRTTEAVMLTTRVGEIRRVELEDGSTVTLDTNTSLELRVGPSHRIARVERGRARFEIAAAREPFVLQSRSATVTSMQGIVDIDDSMRDSRIAVLAGSAGVSSSADRAVAALTLGAGDVAAPARRGLAVEHHLARGSDWTRGMLQFDGTALVDALALANRYSDRHIMAGANLGDLRVTGAFHAGDIAGLAKALATAFNLSVSQRPDGNLVLLPLESESMKRKRGG